MEDEDRIIESLLNSGLPEGQNFYQDSDFLPVKTSLYSNENLLPEYDFEVTQNIQWCRPNEITEDPVYFNPASTEIVAKQGSLPDGNFIGTLLAICVYSKYDLIENVFASRPEDFRNYGIYTCRFYVDGEWVEVITDTMIPCFKDNLTGWCSPAYGKSDDTNELWIPLVEKAFAKAVGSYEEISNMKIQKALLHLTGGSVQAVNLRDEVHKLDTKSQDENLAWNQFKDRFNEECLVLLQPMEKVDSPQVPKPGTYLLTHPNHRTHPTLPYQKSSYNYIIRSFAFLDITYHYSITYAITTFTKHTNVNLLHNSRRGP
jgi:hypothetical protein